MVLIVLVLVVATLIAMIRGGKLRNIIDVQLALWWLLPFGFLIQVATSWLPDDADWAPTLGLWMILFSFFLLVVVVIANRRRPGMWLAGVGILLNFTVIALNGGMPVLAEAAFVASGFEQAQLLISDYKHVEMVPGTRLTVLADVIPLRFLGIGQVISLGDVLLAIGLGQFLESELRRPIRWFKHGPQSAGGSASSTVPDP